jgi:hypothetical protein
MDAEAQEYIDFWIENSVHAADQTGSLAASQDVAVLVRRLIDGAAGQGISEHAMQAVVGDLTEYVSAKLNAANEAATDRNEEDGPLLDIVRVRKERSMANDNNRNPNVKQPGENPDGTYHFNPGNMAGKKPDDAKQSAENRDEAHKPKEKPAS